MPKPEQPKRRNKPADYKVPEEERMIDLEDSIVVDDTTPPPAGSMYTGDRFNWIDIGDDFPEIVDTEELEPPPTPQATPKAVRRKYGMDALRRTPEPSVVTPESQPPQAIVVAEFTATVNRGDPQWTRPIEKKRYTDVNPNLTPDKFPLQSIEIEMTEEKFVDLDFSNWAHNPSTREVLAEAARLGYSCLDRAASESSLTIRPIGPNGRSVICICTDEWMERGVRVVGVVVGYARGRVLDVDRLDVSWIRENCVFRFGARK